MKKTIYIVLIFLIAVMNVSLVFAESANKPKYLQEAELLKSLGLFQGTTNGFELDRRPTRAEGAVMLVRLLGKEGAALDMEYAHTFNDVPSWADAHVGYMVEFGLTTGVSQERFGSNDYITAAQYGTFVLRALDYDDRAGDFVWNESIHKLLEIHLIEALVVKELNHATFLRDHVALLSHHALKSREKNSDTRLIDKLVSDGAVTNESAMQAGLIIDKVEMYQRLDNEMKKDPINIEKIFALIDNGAAIANVFELAIFNNVDLEIIELLIQKTNAPDMGLHHAIFRGKLSVVELLLESGADPNGLNLSIFNQMTTPLYVAVQMGPYLEYDKKTKQTMTKRTDNSIEMVNLLLDYGAIPAPLDVLGAVLANNYDIVDHYISLGFDVNSFGPTLRELNTTGREIVPGHSSWILFHQPSDDEAKETISIFMQLIYQTLNFGDQYFDMVELFVRHGATLDDSLSQEQLDELLRQSRWQEMPLLIEFFKDVGAK